eukprot:4751090-Amphidinium_carterae.1
MIGFVLKGFFHSGSRQQGLGHEEPVDFRAIFVSVLPMLHRGGGYFITDGPMNRGPVHQVDGK